MLATRPSLSDEALLVAALRRGDETAFITLIERHGAAMLRVAQSFVRSRAVAEEVVQETWLAVLTGVARFGGRASVKTWVFRILTNRAKTRAEREGRCLPFSCMNGGDEADGPAVHADRFQHERYPGGWSAPPRDWRTIPDERLLGQETLAVFRDAVHE